MLYALVFAAGLFLGWFVIPQPAWAKRIYDWMRG